MYIFGCPVTILLVSDISRLYLFELLEFYINYIYGILVLHKTFLYYL